MQKSLLKDVQRSAILENSAMRKENRRSQRQQRKSHSIEERLDDQDNDLKEHNESLIDRILNDGGYMSKFDRYQALLHRDTSKESKISIESFDKAFSRTSTRHTAKERDIQIHLLNEEEIALHSLFNERFVQKSLTINHCFS